MKIDKTAPYPYLPGYTGTIEERDKIIKSRLNELLRSLELLERKYAEGRRDISLLADVEKCQVIVRELIE